MYRGDQAVNSLCLSDDDFFLDECSVRRACDLEIIYVDPTKSLQEHGHLEKRVPSLRTRPAAFITNH